MGAGAVCTGAPPRFSLSSEKDSHGNDENDGNENVDDVEVTLPVQVREEQVESLLVLVVVVTTALVIIIIMMRTVIMTMVIIMMNRPAPQALARPGDFVLFLLGMLMFT